MAEAVFRALSSTNNDDRSSIAFNVDSAGLSTSDTPLPPDPYVISTLAKHRHDLTGFSQRSSRAVRSDDFHKFDYILAVDDESLEELLELQEKEEEREQAAGQRADPRSAHVRLFGDFVGAGDGKVQEVGCGQAVPDPYFDNGEDNFEVAYQMIKRFSEGFLDYLQTTTQSRSKQ